MASLFDAAGAYGGPARVALNLTAELSHRGHVVTLAGATSGYDVVPGLVDGVACQWFPARTVVPGVGFAGLAAHGLLRKIRAEITEYDVVHVHLARDFVTLPVALMARHHKVPYVVQPHGMVDASSRLLAVPLDRLWTRPALRGASRVLYLTRTELRRLEEFGGHALPVALLGNGVPPAGDRAWPVGPVPEVIFLARLHPRKRAAAFVRVARRLLEDGVSARFAVVGPPGGAEREVQNEVAAAGSDAIRYEGPIAPDHVPARLAAASLYVLPSVEEPYPMSVLEAMAVGRPVVVGRSCGLAEAVERHGCGVTVDDSEESLAQAIRYYLDNPDEARSAGGRGLVAARTEFALPSVVDNLERIYHEVTSASEVRR
ncbi:glycosyltransferase [Gordonia hankookensis]|uniref:Glycosyltransferase n=1 Tax=Gordonia hankookensis TaxID=589403 RepID=A0ABR7W889_9ACTN|nr:glycosyltransferase [Gordonia hankookensis]MBD1319029.1 glycosyltransferase [Gordonia hankookensis]